MDAYLAGLEQARRPRASTCRRSHSVASFFVSPRRHRDRQAARRDRHRRGARPSRARPAIANARLAYEAYEEVFVDRRAGRRWPTPAPTPQRPLWASTGVKDPSLPRHPLRHRARRARTPSTRCRRRPSRPIADHGVVTGDTVTGGYADAPARCSTALDALGIAYAEVDRAAREARASRSSRESGTSCSTPSSGALALAGGRATVSHARVAVAGGRRRPRRRSTARRVARTLGRASRRREPHRRAATRTLWGPAAEAEASIRLGWVDAPPTSRPLVAEIVALRDELPPRASTASCWAAWAAPRSPPRSSPAPRASPLVVLDRTDPGQVRAALGDRPRTAPSSSSRSKSGSHGRDRQPARAFEAAFTRRRASTRTSASSSSPTRARRSSRPSLAAGYRRLPRRPDRRRPLLARSPPSASCPPGSPGVDIGGAARRGRGASPTCSPTTPTATRRSCLGRRDRAAPKPLRDKLVIVDRRHRHRRLRRLGRAAHRRVHRQGRHRHPAGRRRRPTLPRLRASASRRPCRSCASSATRRRPTRASPTAEVDDRRPARARRCCSGSTPRPSPGGCSASTRSTSRTSRAPRRPPAACSTHAPSRRRADFVDGAVEVRGDRRAGSAASTDLAAPSTRCSAQLGPTTATSPSWPTSTA